METIGSAASTDVTDRTMRKIVIEAWQHLGCPAVGKRELLDIQDALCREVRNSLSKSPAAIARMLADEGADLRHPEVIQCDTHWRQSEMEKEAARLSELDGLFAERPLSLTEVHGLIKKMEKARLRFEKSGDQPSVNQLRALAISTKQRAHLYANNETNDAQTQAAQAEVAEWFAIWLQTPDLFADWLELRRRAPEFIAHFGDAT